MNVNDGDPAWGVPPVPDVVARLLRERWSIPAEERLAVEVDESTGALSLDLGAGRVVYRLRVQYQAGATGEDDPWMLMADALDALLGELEEQGRAHRTLPSGDGVEFRGARFRVEVERLVPELVRVADRLLGQHPGSQAENGSDPQ